MSGIAGIFNLDGKPVDRDMLKRMTDAIPYRGPDGIHHWVDGPVGLAHCMLHTTPESLDEHQPLTDETGRLCLTMDGRVDNRNELRSLLQAKGYQLRDHTDAELVLRSYECWGEDCADQIIGDFALAIWDSATRRLYCARDFWGVKLFYYWTNGRTFLFCSELHQLFADAIIPKTFNEGFIKQLVEDSISSKEDTLYQGIMRLHPGYHLAVEPGRIRKRRFWHFNPNGAIHYRRKEEYYDHFRYVFREAVKCRLRSHRPIGALLSGGLDSSSVVGMAQDAIRKSEVDVLALEALTLTFPGLPCDETSYSGEVINKWRLPWKRFEFEAADIDQCHKDIRHYRDLPDYPNISFLDLIRNHARQNGLRVVLTGLGGDECTRRCRVHALSPLRSRMRNWLPFQISTARLLNVHLMQQIYRPVWQACKGVSRPKKQSLDSTPALRHFQRQIYQKTSSCAQLHFFELNERSWGRHAVEVRHPFFDRRLVEYMLALPDSQLVGDGYHVKPLQSQALSQLLPSKVRERTSKAVFNVAMEKALSRIADKGHNQIAPGDDSQLSQYLRFGFTDNQLSPRRRWRSYWLSVWFNYCTRGERNLSNA